MTLEQLTDKDKKLRGRGREFYQTLSASQHLAQSTENISVPSVPDVPTIDASFVSEQPTKAEQHRQFSQAAQKMGLKHKLVVEKKTQAPITTGQIKAMFGLKDELGPEGLVVINKLLDNGIGPEELKDPNRRRQISEIFIKPPTQPVTTERRSRIFGIPTGKKEITTVFFEDERPKPDPKKNPITIKTTTFSQRVIRSILGKPNSDSE